MVVGTNYTTWNTYQLNWNPQLSEWLINGVSKLNETYDVDMENSSIQIKMWSDGGSWTGNMSVGDEARIDIQWIDLLFDIPVVGIYYRCIRRVRLKVR